MKLTMPRHLATLAAAAGMAVLAAAAAAQPAGSLARLRQGDTLSCQPSHPYFCANMHVACAGQTPLATLAFSLRIVDGKAAVAAAAPEGAELVEGYRDAAVTWDATSASAILRPAAGPGYVRVQDDGRYSWRLVRGAGGSAVMSIGHCR